MSAPYNDLFTISPVIESAPSVDVSSDQLTHVASMQEVTTSITSDNATNQKNTDSQDMFEQEESALSAELFQQTCEERLSSLPFENRTIKRKLSNRSDRTSLLPDNEFCDLTLSNNSCDIVLSGSNDYLTKEHSWSNCYAPFKKNSSSTLSSDSIRDKFFSEEEKERYIALKQRRSQKLEEDKSKLRSEGIRAAYKALFKEESISSILEQSEPVVCDQVKLNIPLELFPISDNNNDNSKSTNSVSTKQIPLFTNLFHNTTENSQSFLDTVNMSDKCDKTILEKQSLLAQKSNFISKPIETAFSENISNTSGLLLKNKDSLEVDFDFDVHTCDKSDLHVSRGIISSDDLIFTAKTANKSLKSGNIKKGFSENIQNSVNLYNSNKKHPLGIDFDLSNHTNKCVESKLHAASRNLISSEVSTLIVKNSNMSSENSFSSTIENVLTETIKSTDGLYCSEEDQSLEINIEFESEKLLLSEESCLNITNPTLKNKSKIHKPPSIENSVFSIPDLLCKQTEIPKNIVVECSEVPQENLDWTDKVSTSETTNSEVVLTTESGIFQKEEPINNVEIANFLESENVSQIVDALEASVVPNSDNVLSLQKDILSAAMEENLEISDTQLIEVSNMDGMILDESQILLSSDMLPSSDEVTYILHNGVLLQCVNFDPQNLNGNFEIQEGVPIVSDQTGEVEQVISFIPDDLHNIAMSSETSVPLTSESVVLESQPQVVSENEQFNISKENNMLHSGHPEALTKSFVNQVSQISNFSQDFGGLQKVSEITNQSMDISLSDLDSVYQSHIQMPQLNIPSQNETQISAEGDKKLENEMLEIKSDYNTPVKLDDSILKIPSSGSKTTARKSLAKRYRLSSDTANSDDEASSGSENQSSSKKKVFKYFRDENGVFGLSKLPNDAVETKHAALKTFKKPFTVAKKSISDKSGLESVLQSFFGVRTAKKTCYSLNQKSSFNEVSDDEFSSSSENRKCVLIKNGLLSELACHCATEEIPCLCNGESLQIVCEAEDTIDNNIVPCSKKVSQQSLLSPSGRIQRRVFCDIHQWRLHQHQCCPNCGLFCTQGVFQLCRPSKGDRESHLFHPECFLILEAGLPPSCPHCCTFSDFLTVELGYSEAPILQNFDEWDIDLTKGLENYDIFMKVCDKKADINGDGENILPKADLKSMVMTISGKTSLHLRPAGKCLFNPIKKGDLKKVLQLIVNGVNPNHNFESHKNNTPLHIAAYYGHITIVHLLLQYGALINAGNRDLETPLILAIQKNQIDMVRFLIQAGAEINHKNEDGLTSFHVACKNGTKEIAKLLFDSGKFDVNIQDDGGWTSLVWACEHGCPEFVKWLLSIKANPNIRDNEENIALHWAACSGKSDVLTLLLDFGCNLSFVNARGDSPLHIAARKDNSQCVKILLSRGASAHLKNKDGENSLMCCDENTKSLQYLKHHFKVTPKLRATSSKHILNSDISRGFEVFPVEVVNEIDDEEIVLTNFRYLVKNCYAKNIHAIATVDSMKVCLCKDNCCSLSCTCTNLTRYPYDMDGCLTGEISFDDPLIIYECNKTCHCPKSCNNRVVQKGLRNALQVFRTVSHGWGVRSLKNIPKGTFVCEYVGEIVSKENITEQNDDSYLFDLDSKTGNYYLDGCLFGNVARFINHSCEPNLICSRVFIEHQDSNFPRIAFFAFKEIQALEELCFDYGTKYWIAKSQTTLCTCGTPSCKFSKDSIDDTLQAYVDQESLMDVS